MYYGLIVISVIMFGACFAMKDVYRRMRGSGVRVSIETSFMGAVAGLAVLLIINKFHVEFTPFTLLMATLASVNGFAFTFCSFKALDHINLSLFSLFSMLGGMALPFLQGIIFYGEDITLSKIICFLLICVALGVTVTKGEKKKGFIYYIGIFVLNGMSGVLSKIFTSAPYEKTGSASYTMWIAITTILISGIIWIIIFRKNNESDKFTMKAAGLASLTGATNKVANFLLVIALAHVDASVQYPMVTGGVMIVSTLACYLSDKKPSRREILSVIIAFCAMLALFLIKI